MSLRSSWNGTLRFSALNVPVKLASTQSGNEGLRLLHRDCHQPLGQTMSCPVHGEVAEAEQVRGWEVSPGEFVVVEPEEIAEAIAAVELDEHVLETIAVVPVEDIDPAAVKGRYYLMPGAGLLAVRQYRLLQLALEPDSALLVRFQAFRTDHVAAIRPLPGRSVLLVEDLAAAADVHASDEIDEQVSATEVSDAELELAIELVSRVRADLDPTLLRSDRRDAVRALLERKLAEQPPVRPVAGVAARPPQTPSGEATPADLLQQLKASIKQTPKPRAKRATRKKAAA